MILNEINKIKSKINISKFRAKKDHEELRQILAEQNKSKDIMKGGFRKRKGNNAAEAAKKKKEEFQKWKKEVSERYSEQEVQAIIEKFEAYGSKNEISHLRNEYLTILNITRVFFVFIIYYFRNKRIKLDSEFNQKVLNEEKMMDESECGSVKSKILAFTYIRDNFDFKRKIDWRKAQEEYSKALNECSIF